jgi:Phage terminase large subunit
MDRSIEKLNLKYAPLPSQTEFHACQARFKGFSGPVGSGKSQALCHEAIKLSYLNPGRMGLLGAPNYPMLRAATQAILFETLETNRFRFEHNKAENTLVLSEIGSKILFRPVDEFESLRGANLAWFGIDELTYTQEAAWLRLEARLRDPKASRLCGFGVWTPKGYDWVYRRFVADKRPKDYLTIFAKPEENTFLADNYYRHLEDSYDENFYKQEVLGEYLNLTADVVYSAFRREIHLKDLELEPYAPLLWTLDFNVSPMCSLIAQRIGPVVRVLDEIVIRHGTTEQVCRELLTRISNHRQNVVVYGDSSGHHFKTSGASDYDMIQDYLSQNFRRSVTYKIPKSNPSVRARINLTNASLRSASGIVSVMVDPKCKELIMDFEQVLFEEHTYAIDKNRDRQRTHLSDALGYLLWQEFKQEPQIGERQGRIL